MEAPDTLHPVPLTIDPSTKALTTTDPTLTTEIEALNSLHRHFTTLETPSLVPPMPGQVSQKRTVQLDKLRESGNASYKKGAHNDALKMYELAMKMALERPPWEAAGLVREQMSALYNNRAQTFMAQQMWVEAAVDAESSVECKRVGNVKAYWRRGQCLREMGRVGEAREWVKGGLDLERVGPEKASVGELEALAKELATL